MPQPPSSLPPTPPRSTVFKQISTKKIYGKLEYGSFSTIKAVHILERM
jgi:hypothetical protein